MDGHVRIVGGFTSKEHAIMEGLSKYSTMFDRHGAGAANAINLVLKRKEKGKGVETNL